MCAERDPCRCPAMLGEGQDPGLGFQHRSKGILKWLPSGFLQTIADNVQCVVCINVGLGISFM